MTSDLAALGLRPLLWGIGGPRSSTVKPYRIYDHCEGIMSLAKVFHKWPVCPRPKVFLWILVGRPTTTDIDVRDELTFLVRMSVSKLEGA